MFSMVLDYYATNGKVINTIHMPIFNTPPTTNEVKLDIIHDTHDDKCLLPSNIIPNIKLLCALRVRFHIYFYDLFRKNNGDAVSELILRAANLRKFVG